MIKKLTVISVVLLSCFLVSCGQSNTETGSDADTRKEQDSRSDRKITVEKYVSYYKEADALLMEKYWPQLKGKSYSDAKDLYAQYKAEEKSLLEKYNIKNVLKLSSFFRRNFKEVEEYRQNDADYKTYPEHDAAKQQITSFAMDAIGG